MSLATLYRRLHTPSRRERPSVRRAQISAETVIGLIRDRLLVQSRLPALPVGWTVDIEQRPANGAAIAGDFVSNRVLREDDCTVLHLAVVDVSGNGLSAGPRSLLLSGAVGGLLGTVPAEDFLTAANDYLARQQWSLGFASAIYLRLDLDTGDYGIRVAGHPPAMHYRPSSEPPWQDCSATGTVLGVLPTLTGTLDLDTLQPGEALVLYTDGVVEDRTQDIDAGTMRLKDHMHRLADSGNWAQLARQLVDSAPGATDDRTVVVIRRQTASDSESLTGPPDAARKS